MSVKILLIGKNGQIGRDLNFLLPRLGEMTALGREKLDLTKPNDIREAVRTIRPNVIVNAAAYTAVDQAESDELAAHAINAEAPGLLAEEAKKAGALLVHFSTDYVFDGLKRAPYNEDDPANPVNIYGKTKLEGERRIQASSAVHIIFRTEWVYSREGRNFLLTILRLATHQKELRIVDDQIGAPTSSREIAAATVHVLEKALAGQSGPCSLSDVSGVYHMTAAGETTWYGFAKAILEEAAQVPPNDPWLGVATGHHPLVTRRVFPISTAEYPTPARRPSYTVLSNAKLERTFGVRMPDWREQLHSVFAGPSMCEA